MGEAECWGLLSQLLTYAGLGGVAIMTEVIFLTHFNAAVFDFDFAWNEFLKAFWLALYKVRVTVCVEMQSEAYILPSFSLVVSFWYTVS